MNLGEFTSACPKITPDPLDWEILKKIFEQLKSKSKSKPAGDPPDFYLGSTPVAYNEKAARVMLGGISRTELWRQVLLGNLERIPGTRRLLITRQSILDWPERMRERAERKQKARS